MSKTKSQSKTPRKSDPMTDLIGGLTMFSGVIALWLLPRYFGSFTVALAGFCGVFGFYGLGKGIDGIMRADPVEMQQRESEVFTSLGAGAAGVLIWAIIRYYLPWSWIQILSFFLLLVGMWGINTGLVSALVTHLADQYILGVTRIPATVEEDARASLKHGYELSYRQRIKTILGVVGIVIGFLANLLTVLNILGIVGSNVTQGNAPTPTPFVIIGTPTLAPVTTVPTDTLIPTVTILPADTPFPSATTTVTALASRETRYLNSYSSQLEIAVPKARIMP